VKNATLDAMVELELVSRHEYYRPGECQITTGPMYSGKTESLKEKVRRYRFSPSLKVFVFKPESDVRNPGYLGRDKHEPQHLRIPAVMIPDNAPEVILEYAKEAHVLIGDEIQFFAPTFADVIYEARRSNKYLELGGLLRDFRGVSFNAMGDFMAQATRCVMIPAFCPVGGKCMNQATETQRLRYGRPVPYDDPILSVEGEEDGITYEPRCVQHHEVPGRKVRIYGTMP